MGNGAVGVFDAPDDPDSDPQQEDQNVLTIRDYYETVYNLQDLDAISNYVDLHVKVHRDRKVLTGRDNLKDVIIATLTNHGHLTATLRETVAAGARVSYRSTWTTTRAAADRDGDFGGSRIAG